MYESDRRRAAPLTSLYTQQTPAAGAVSARMARTDAIGRGGAGRLPRRDCRAYRPRSNS